MKVQFFTHLREMANSAYFTYSIEDRYDIPNVVEILNKGY